MRGRLRMAAPAAGPTAAGDGGRRFAEGEAEAALAGQGRRSRRARGRGARARGIAGVGIGGHGHRPAPPTLDVGEVPAGFGTFDLQGNTSADGASRFRAAGCGETTPQKTSFHTGQSWRGMAGAGSLVDRLPGWRENRPRFCLAWRGVGRTGVWGNEPIRAASALGSGTGWTRSGRAGQAHSRGRGRLYGPGRPVLLFNFKNADSKARVRKPGLTTWAVTVGGGIDGIRTRTISLGKM